ncbi:DNA-formamidopyrimidine glycosylase [Virgibacillus oceani]|uniref:Formamidopyrimidine-DNA glycosylase n=1 Tax=Virgibacillus oceani TaxID=1479511 RepID=A0A917GYW8_9BACI|nr:DNA-formamidopyrimidine glycosylase [Virgibacillus oceani]GGG61908.1 formamidopyrimidine-DNA glycosylase [Virgibacillus oceani]
MPELPEVETIKNTLKQFVLEKTIENVEVFWPNIVKMPDDIEQFKHILHGQTIQDITRKGKFLLFQLDAYVLVSHLRMEGKYSVHQSKEPMKKHTHVAFTFSDGEELRYNDVRKFGTMHVFKKGDELKEKPLIQLGPDPFEQDFSFAYFYEKLKKTDRVIKAALLDQTIVAGLGNIYVDETLFKAGVHPLKKASKLTKKEVKAIQKEATATLKEAVAQGGTTIRSYVNGQGEMGMFQQELFVYGQENQACKNCGKPIVKMKIGGRGTHLCVICQKP